MNENRMRLLAPTVKEARTVDSVRIGNYIYHPWDSIGLGYISNVYLGRHTTSKTQVAIKVINTAKQDSLVKQFLESQIAILEKINLYNCQHLLRLLEHYRQDDKIYLITEYCEGNDLAKALRTKKQYTEEQAQTIMKQVLLAYGELYQLGLVHRDLKLSNFMVQVGKLKLGDFGFALEIFNCTEEFPYNAGSPVYMAPESLKRNRFSFESDIWALGVIAFQLVAGQVPIKQKIQSMQYEGIMNCDISKKLDTLTGISNHYKQFIIRCMQKDMRTRATAEEVKKYQWPKALSQINNEMCAVKKAAENPPELKSHSYQLFSQKLNESPPQSKNNLKWFNDSSLFQGSLSTTNIRDSKKPIVFSSQKSNQPLPQMKVLNRSNKRPSFTYPQVEKDNPSLVLQRPTVKSFAEGLIGQSANRSQSVGGSRMRRQEVVAYSVINYCRFLYKIYYCLMQKQSNLPQGKLLSSQISQAIRICYKQLNNFLKGIPNKLGNIPDLANFSQTYIYSQLKQTVETNQHFHFSKISNTGLSVPSEVLIEVIRFLSNQNSSNGYLLEQLCHYCQLRSLTNKSLQQLTKRSNLQLLGRDLIVLPKMNQVQWQQLRIWASRLTNKS